MSIPDTINPNLSNPHTLPVPIPQVQPLPPQGQPLPPPQVPPVRRISPLSDEIIQKIQEVTRYSIQCDAQRNAQYAFKYLSATFLTAGAIGLLSCVIMTTPPALLLIASIVCVVVGFFFTYELFIFECTASNDLARSLTDLLKASKGNISDDYPQVQELFRNSAKKIIHLELKWEQGFRKFSNENVHDLIDTLALYFTGLTSLKLESFQFLDSVSLSPLRNLSQLIDLDISKSDIDDATILGIRHLTNLKKLTMKWCHNITVDGLETLGNPNRGGVLPPLCLTELDISGSRLNPLSNTVAELKERVADLLDLAPDEVYRQTALEKMSNETDKTIDFFELAKNGKVHTITEVELSPLRHFTNLKKLSLSHLNDNAVTFISQTLPLLEELIITYSPSLTGSSFNHLSRLKSLVQIQIDRCKNLTAAGMKFLVEIPHLKNIHFIHPVKTYIEAENQKTQILTTLLTEFEPFPRIDEEEIKKLTSEDIKDFWVRKLY